MKKLSAIWIFFVVFALTSGTAFAIGYCKDITPTNPPDKTFEDEWIGIVGEEIEIDIYLNDLPETLLTAGVFIPAYDFPIEITAVQVYDGVNGPPGPWDPAATFNCWTLCAGPPPLPVIVTVANPLGAVPDEDGDIIVCRIRIRFHEEGDYNIMVSTVLGVDTVMGFETSTVYDPQIIPNTVTVHQIIVDSDADGIPDHEDNCPLHPNSPELGICLWSSTGKTCLSDEECGYNGFCSMDQADDINCDCPSNFDCDYDVDGSDAAKFKADFGRSMFDIPCTNEDPCNGDFECDGDVDGTNAAKFKERYGTVPLPPYGYCLSCVDGVYSYTCTYE
jgi:hypothetical protein